MVSGCVWPQHATHCVAKVPPLGVDKTQAMPRLLQSSEGQRSCSSPASSGGEATRVQNFIVLSHFACGFALKNDPGHVNNANSAELRLPLHKLGSSLRVIICNPCPWIASYTHEMLISWVHSSATPTCRESAASSLQRPAVCSSLSSGGRELEGVKASFVLKP